MSRLYCGLCILKIRKILRSGVGMKYIKAEEILPEKLLREIQDYVSGELIYIPSLEGMRKGWGEKSGTRDYLRKRNMEIRARFREGMSIDQLSEIFCLSCDSIKKIVYAK